MSYEDTAGLNVNNQYGPRSVGGAEGVYKHYGVEQEFVIDYASDGPDYVFPAGVEVYGVDLTFATGTVTEVKIGNTEVFDSTSPAYTYPISISDTNAGGFGVVVTGLTGGRLIINYKKSA